MNPSGPSCVDAFLLRHDQEMEHLMNVPGTGNIFTPKSEQLSDLLNSIAKHKTALPNVQRPWVWEPHMVQDLLVSVAYRYPAGSLLTMPVSTTDFSLRPFEGCGASLTTMPNLDESTYGPSGRFRAAPTDSGYASIQPDAVSGARFGRFWTASSPRRLDHSGFRMNDDRKKTACSQIECR